MPKIDYKKAIKELNSIGVSLTKNHNKELVLEGILEEAMKLTNSDAGSLYLPISDEEYSIEIMINKSLNIKYGGSTEKIVPFDPIKIYIDGKPNYCNVVSSCILNKEIILVDDAYHCDEYNFTGTKAFDELTEYHSKSFLTVPMISHDNKVIGVLQLINSIENENIIEFDDFSKDLTQSLASQACILLSNINLIEVQRNLFNDFIHLIARAIDEKSPHTGGHCSRVPIICEYLANSVNESSDGTFKNFNLSKEELYELSVASWLHDCGKIATPEYVIDKATKLQKMFDRISNIELKMELIIKDAKNKIDDEVKLNNYIKELQNDFEFIKLKNYGSEILEDKDINRIDEIKDKYYWFNYDGKKRYLLDEDEVYNLKITKGTLNPEERKIIQNHVVLTHEMLTSLHYPDYLKNVPDIASSHHERVDGNGYHRGKDITSMSVQARILAISDIFEALTAKDRPYKDPKKLSEVLRIMDDMSRTGHIDPDIYSIFKDKNVHLKYASKFLPKEQNDL